MQIRFKKLHHLAQIPKQATDGSAGFDLTAAAPEMLDALEGCCPLACGASYDECAVEGGLIVGGECNNIASCPVWSAIQKARGKQ